MPHHRTMDTTDREQLQRILERYGPLEFGKIVAQLAAEGAQRQDAADVTHDPRCSFCGKRKSEVKNRLIAGPGVFICIHCLNLCQAVRMQQWPDHK